jgi:hypothetical protein
MLKDDIKKDFMIAYKKKDKVTADTLKMIKAAIQYMEVEFKSKNKSISDEDVIKLLKIELKKRKESFDQYEKAGREEQANRELEEAEIIKKYVPAPLSFEEIQKIVSTVINEIPEDKRNFGTIMKKSMARTNGKADGKVVKETIEKILDN